MTLLVISGLGESATSEAHGLTEFARRFRGKRFAWGERARIVYEAWSGTDVVMVGHSFGGSVAAEIAARLNPSPVTLYLIDPVPTQAWDRWIRNRIRLTDNVREAVAYLRSDGLYPFAKRIEEGPYWKNVVVPGTGHNSVVAPALEEIAEKMLARQQSAA